MCALTLCVCVVTLFFNCVYINLCRFTQNLSVFRREVNDSMKNSSYGVNTNDMMS